MCLLAKRINGTAEPCLPRAPLPASVPAVTRPEFPVAIDALSSRGTHESLRRSESWRETKVSAGLRPRSRASRERHSFRTTNLRPALGIMTPETYAGPKEVLG